VNILIYPLTAIKIVSVQEITYLMTNWPRISQEKGQWQEGVTMVILQGFQAYGVNNSSSN
jgi:hypothetical protein